ncbi:hypothetical protein [Eubacterium sp.]
MRLKIDTGIRYINHCCISYWLMLPEKLQMLGCSREAYDEISKLYLDLITGPEIKYNPGDFALCILKDFCRLETPILERYIKLLIFLDDNELLDRDKDILKEELDRIKKVIDLECEYEGIYVTEDGQTYKQMHKALEHAKENPLMYTCCEIHKKNAWSKEDECIFWYNSSYQLVGYELLENDEDYEQFYEKF